MKTILLVAAILASVIGQELLYQSWQSETMAKHQSWNILNAKGEERNYLTKCHGKLWLGGYDTFGQQATLVRTFKLPSHYSIEIDFDFLKVDSWDNEKFYTYVDDQIAVEDTFAADQGEPLCGGKKFKKHHQKDLIKHYNFKVQHNAAHATLVLGTNLNEDASNESWAIKDFKLKVYKCSGQCTYCTTDSECSGWQIGAGFWDRNQIKNEGWQVDGSESKSTECSGVKMFGQFGQGTHLRKSVKLPPHYQMKVQFQFWKVDQWNDEKLNVLVDGQTSYSRPINSNVMYPTNLCGNAFLDLRQQLIDVEFDQQHTSETVDLEISTTLESDQKQWGVKDMFIYYSPCSAHCSECTGPSEQECSVCSAHYSLQEGKCEKITQFKQFISEFSSNDFTDLQGWEIKNHESKHLISTCGNTKLVGGYSILGKGASSRKTYNDIPEHKRIKINMQLWKIDQWEDQDLIVRADNQEIYRVKSFWMEGGAQLCGKDNSWGEKYYDMEVIMDHDKPTLNLEIGSTLNKHAYEQSWGFRDVKIEYESIPKQVILFSECNYQGQSMALEHQVHDLQNSNFLHSIKSFKMPENSRLTLYKSTDFLGEKVVFTQSQSCVENMSVMSLSQENKLDGQKNLRH